MYDYIFKYLKEIIKRRSILIYGQIKPTELKQFNISNNNISIVNDSINNLITLKNEYPNIDYNQSLYFIKKKFDTLILLTNSPIIPKDYLNNLGVFINIEFINSDEEYHKLILTEDKKGFEFLERINLYKKEVIISLKDGKNGIFKNDNLFNKTPNIIIEFYSDYKLKLENKVNLT